MGLFIDNPFNSFEAIDLNKERHDQEREETARQEAEKDTCPVCGNYCAYEYYICDCGNIVCWDCVTSCNNCEETICKGCAIEHKGLCVPCSEKEKVDCTLVLYDYMQSLIRLNDGLKYGFSKER